jgi:hypothetical protein
MESKYSLSEVEKPVRPPDIVINPGHAVWWPEMVFLHVYGDVYRIEFDQDECRFYYVKFHGGHRWYFGQQFKELYDKWWYETFEQSLFSLDE